MESLHAPWRIEYILAPKPQMDASLFTRIAQSNDDEANYVIVRDRTCFALLNKYPYVGGHLLTVPYKEVADLNKTFADWSFVLPSYKFSDMSKTMDDMLKPLETKKPEAKDAGKAGAKAPAKTPAPAQ